MRRTAFRAALTAAILIMPAAALAGVALSPIMQSWNHAKHRIDAMLSGRSAYDQAALQQDMQIYIGDATMVAHHIKGGSAKAQDFAGRFTKFATDGQAALASIGQPAVFKARFGQMVNDCESCHAVYNN